MSGPTVRTDVAFVRRESGEVAQLERGAYLPDDVLGTEVERLTAAGVLGEAQASHDETPAPDQEAVAVEPSSEAAVDRPRGRRAP